MAYNWEQGPSKHEFEGLFAARGSRLRWPWRHHGDRGGGFTGDPPGRTVVLPAYDDESSGVANTPTETGERPP
jgi:hypothetical protein